ncbi:MAG: M55 family metallopeptidase [Ktedonobacterales bacterium]
MKVYISTDFEGVAGIVDWDQIMVGSYDYELGRRLLLGELNAAIDGALAAGADSFLVNDSHSSMRNLEPDRLHGKASLLTGKHKPMYMMEGLDESFDAIFFVGYHGSIGASHAVLSHSYNPRAIWEVRLNGDIVGETALNALAAAYYGVPIVLVTGDQVTAAEARQLSPAPLCVEVKRSISRYAAESLHPDIARERIQQGAHAAVESAATASPPTFSGDIELSITFLTADMAEIAGWLHGVDMMSGGTRTVSYTSNQPLEVYRTFVTMVMLTRSLVE